MPLLSELGPLAGKVLRRTKYSDGSVLVVSQHPSRNIQVHTTIYPRDRFRRVWSENAPDNSWQSSARARASGCVVFPVTFEERALKLAAVFVNTVFNYPFCTHWDGKTLSLFCGTSTRDRDEVQDRMLMATFVPDALGHVLSSNVPIFGEDIHL